MKYLWTLFFCLTAAISLADTDTDYLTNLDEALILSKQTQQQVLLIFSASWCDYCETLKNDLQDLPNLDSKIICILDVDSNKKLSRQYKIKTLPTSILFDSSGKAISKISGYENKIYSQWIGNHK